jgi:hypothetical protein
LVCNFLPDKMEEFAVDFFSFLMQGKCLNDFATVQIPMVVDFGWGRRLGTG